MGVKSIFAQTNFTAGEFSPRAFGRFDLAKYQNAVHTLENFLVYQLGGAMFRPGTKHVAEVKDSTKKTRIFRFQYSTVQSYIIEMGDLYMRFFSNGGQVVLTLDDVNAWITSTAYSVGDYVKESSIIYYCIEAHTSGTFATDLAADKWVARSVLEKPSPYVTADLFEVQYTQKKDVMYLVHPNYHPRKLTRMGATEFTIEDVPFKRGPFLDDNITTTTISPSSATGTTTLTASTALFFAGHVGSFWKIKDGYVKVTAYTSPTVVTASVQSEPDGTAGNLGIASATEDWAEGAFSTYRGFPTSVTFHEQRIYYSKEDYLYGSVTGAFDNFKVDAAEDTGAVRYEIVADQENAVRFVSSVSKSLQSGTTSGTFSASSGTTGAPITADSINVSNDTNYGVLGLRPQKISSYLYYVQKNAFQLRELIYNYLVDRQVANDMNLYADHILRDGGGVTDFDHQQSPNDRLWNIREDGQIAVLARNPEQEVMGWSRIKAGTSSGGVAGRFETTAILDRDRADDQIWVICKRKINGVWKRYVEYFTPEYFDQDHDAVRVDSSLTYDVPLAIESISQANPCVVGITSHGLANGDQIRITKVDGMTQLNQNIYVVANSAADTFSLKNTDGEDIDSTDYDLYLEGGQVREMVKTFSGLEHLEGEVVTVFADGGVPSEQQTYTVSGGQITLINKAAVVHIGLPYQGTIKFLKMSDGVDPTAQTLIRKVYLSTVRVYRSLGLKIGKNEDSLQTVYFGTPNQKLGKAPDLVTGDVEKFFQTGWEDDHELVIRQDQPLPLFILAVVFRSEVESR